MKAFISYSLNEQEQYIATLLSYKLREHGFTMIMSNDIYGTVDSTTRNQIFLSQLFIGLITSNSMQWPRVMQEYNLAVSNSTPAILLVEDTVPISPDFKGNVLKFNRNNPHPAIEEIRRRMTPQGATPANNEGLGWLLGGAALLAIMALLSDKK